MTGRVAEPTTGRAGYGPRGSRSGRVRSSIHPFVRFAALAALALLAPPPAHAWGPHPQITRAACAALPVSDQVGERLGGQQLLEESCWLADYKGDAFPHWYPNDYLLFPGMARHIGHMLPDARAAWQPYFRRALQALRTEGPISAGRWTGTLLHYVQDSGSPPHAVPTEGAAHGRMENWLKPDAIRLERYSPRLLGKTDDAALAEFVYRMEGLVAFARERGERIRPLVEKADRPAVEPIALEAALECARVSADLLHTLLRLTAGQPRCASLSVTVRTQAHTALPDTPARLLLLGTAFAALPETTAAPLSNRASDYLAELRLRGLPPGVYRPLVYRTGFRPRRLPPVRLRPGATRVLEVQLDPDEAGDNMVRDAAHAISWTTPAAAEHWRRVGSGDAAAWETAAVPVRMGARYSLGVRLRPGSQAQVTARWDQYVDFGEALRRDALSAPGRRTVIEKLVAPQKSRLLRLVITTPEPLAAVEHAWVVLDSAAPLEVEGRYVRRGSAGSELEAEFTQRPEGDGLIQVSRTYRAGGAHRVEVARDASGALQSAEVGGVAPGERPPARVTWAERKATIVRDGMLPLTLECPADAIVTSAPDWSDILMVARRYDVARGGRQSSPGLWVHPTQPPQRLEFTAEHVGEERAQWGMLWLDLFHLEVRIRGGSLYDVWVLEDRRVVRFQPRGGAPIWLEGYEQPACGRAQSEIP